MAKPAASGAPAAGGGDYVAAFREACLKNVAKLESATEALKSDVMNDAIFLYVDMLKS